MIKFLKSLFSKLFNKNGKVGLKISKEAKKLYKEKDFHRTEIHLWKGLEFQGTVSEVLTTQKGEHINNTLVQNNLLATKYKDCSHLYVGASQKLTLREFFDFATTYPDIENELEVRKSKAFFYKTIVYLTVKDKQFAKEWHTMTDKEYINRQEEKLRILEYYSKKGIFINSVDFGQSEFLGVAEKNQYLSGSDEVAKKIKQLQTPLHERPKRRVNRVRKK